MASGSLKGRTALVTGGGTGVGLGCTRRLLPEGVRVTMAAGRVEVLEQAAERLRCEIAGADLAVAGCDVTVEDEVAEAVRGAAGRGGRLDIVVASAGSRAPGPIMAFGSDDWRFASDERRNDSRGCERPPETTFRTTSSPG